MSEIERKNAKIIDAWIGKEDHGIMTCNVGLDYGGSGQGFGGYALDAWNEKLQRRIGTAYGMEWIMQLLATVEVERFDQLIDASVRVEADMAQVHRIGHYLKEQWFDPTKIMVEP